MKYNKMNILIKFKTKEFKFNDRSNNHQKIKFSNFKRVYNQTNKKINN